MAEHWITRAPAMLQSDVGPRGEVCATPMDRRWLWRLKGALAVSAPMGSYLRDLADDLRQYLNETCEHHWHEHKGDDIIARHRQCLWCADVEWLEPLASGETSRG